MSVSARKVSVSLLVYVLLLQLFVPNLNLVSAASVSTSFQAQLTDEQNFNSPDFGSSNDWGDNNTSLQIPGGSFTGTTVETFNYFAVNLTPSLSGAYTIEVKDAALIPSADGWGYIVNGNNVDAEDDTAIFLYSSFNRNSSRSDLILANDDVSNTGASYHANNNFKSKLIDVNLIANTTYTLVATSFQPNVSGSLSFGVTGPGSVAVEANENSKGYIPPLTVSASDVTGAGTDGKTNISVAETAGAGNKFVYKNFGVGAVTIPNVGDSLTGYADLPNDGIITAANGDKIAVAELDGANKVVRFGQTTAVVVAEPSTTFTVSETGTLIIDALTEGYMVDKPDSDEDAMGVQKYVTLTKVGTGAITNLAASISGGVNSKFVVGTVNPNALGAGSLSVVMNIRPQYNLPVGTHTETVTITADGGISHSFVVSFTVNASPTTFTVSETGTLTFDPLTEGYTTVQRDAIVEDIVLTKVGNGAITNLSVALSGEANTKFLLGTVRPDSLGAGVLSTVLKIRPKTGLAPGTHTETVTITADGGISHTFDVSFTVNASPTTFTVSETGTLIIDALTEGYMVDAPNSTEDAMGVQKYVTLTKVGTGAITNLAVSTSGGVNTKFVVGTVNPNALGAGSLSTVMNIRPQYNLPVGTHTETVTITADGEISHSFVVSFTVNASPTTFTVSETGTLTFDPLTEGYTTVQRDAIVEDIVLTKVGNGAITNLSVALSGEANTKFLLGTVRPDSLGAGVSSAVLKIRPKTGLAPGTHTETVTITADGGISHSFTVSFTVNPSTFTVSETGALTFDALTEEYTLTQQGAIAKDVTLTKVGNGAITNLSVALSGEANTKFLLGTVRSDSLGAGVLSAVLKIRPKLGLAPGTHTETVTITADGGISHSFTVSFTVNALPTYTLTYTAGENGSLLGTTTQIVKQGKSGSSVAALADEGYHFVDWSDGYPEAMRIDLSVTADKSVTANFAINTYTRTYAAGANGSLTGNTSQTVNHGGNATAVTAVPATGYYFVGWSDGVLTATRTDTNVTETKNVTALFSIYTYTLTYTVEGNGSLVGDALQTVSYGGSGTAVTAVPDTGYYFLGWADGVDDATRIDTNVTGSKSIAAQFWIKSYTLTYTAGANGTLTGNASQAVNHGSSGTSVTAVPNEGYHFVEWSDGVTTAARTETNVIAAKNVTATFAINTYPLTYTAGANGTLTGNASQTVEHGSDGTAVTAVPATGYHFVEWSDGVTTAERTDTNVTAEVYTTATFAINTYTLTYTAGPDGTLTGTMTQAVEHGADGTVVKAMPNAGYYFTGWSDGVKTATRTDAGITENLSIVAHFEIIPYIPSDDDNPSSNGVNVLINGKVEKVGTATTGTRGDQKVTTIVIDQKQMEAKLAAEGSGTVVTIPANLQSDIVAGEVNGQILQQLESKQATLEITTDNVSYSLPIHRFGLESLLEQLGVASLQDIQLQLEIAVPDDDAIQFVNDTASNGSFTIVAPPVEFTVRGISGDKTVEITKFDVYVQRTIAIPDGVDPNKITTGVVVEPDGTVRHVPTKIVAKDSKYYAEINSLTNSAYSVVWHPLEFSDVVGHWAQQAVNNMGSRMVIDGIDENRFGPDRDITRAEFAAIVVRGLGLRLERGASIYTDVQESDWYNSAIRTASDYQLINGFEDGTFRPGDKITREEAMVIIARAMKLTELSGTRADQTADSVLRAYADAQSVSGWAKDGVADSVQAGIITGRSNSTLAPEASMTRAETAAMIQRLLQKSELIDRS